MSLIGHFLADTAQGLGAGLQARAERLREEAARKREAALAALKHTRALALADHQHGLALQRDKTQNQFTARESEKTRAHDTDTQKRGLIHKGRLQDDAQTHAANQASLGRAHQTYLADPTVQTFHDEASGLEYKAQYNKDQKRWDQVGGTKAAKPPSTGWNEKSVTDYFTKEAYRQLGIQADTFSVPMNDSSPDHEKAKKWIATAVDRWRGMQGAEDPAYIAQQVFNADYHQGPGSQSNTIRLDDGREFTQFKVGNDWVIEVDGQRYKVESTQ